MSALRNATRRRWSMTTRLLPRAWSPSGNRLYDPKFDNLRVCQPWLLLELGSYVLDLLVDTLEGRLSLLHPALSSPVVVTDRLSDRLLELSYGVLGFVRYLVSRSHLRTLGLFQACPADRKQAHEPTSSVSKPSPQGMLHSRMVEKRAGHGHPRRQTAGPDRRRRRPIGKCHARAQA